MKDVKPLLDQDATDFERRWLSAARIEEPPPEIVTRIEHALGLGPTGSAIAPRPMAGNGSAATHGMSALRLGALSLVSIGGAIGLVLWLSRATPPPLRTDRPHASEAIAASTPPLAPPSPPAAPAAHAAAIVTDTLRDELLLIDGARAALAARSPSRALSLLERYLARFPHGILLPEALAIRIEAIDRSGEHARARALARAFLAEYPDSPLRQRVVRLASP